MLNSIFSLDVRFLVDTLAEAESIRNSFNETHVKFEDIVPTAGEEYYRVRYSCVRFGSYDYLEVCRILGKETVAFSVYPL